MITVQIDAESLINQLSSEIIPSYDSTGKTLDTVIDELLAFQRHSNPITKGTIEPTWEDLSGWVTPTGHNDPDTDWNDEEEAYDDDEGTTADSNLIAPGNWSGFLEVTHAGIVCDKVRIMVWRAGQHADSSIDMDVEYDGNWHFLYLGSISHQTWLELDIAAGTQTVTGIRCRQYNSGSINYNFHFYEFDFWGVEGGKLVVTNQTILWALLQLHAIVGEGYIYVDNDRKFHWLNDIGEDKGQQIRYRKNLAGITRETDWGQLHTRLFAFGNDVKLSDITTTRETVDKDSDASYGYLTLSSLYSCYKDWIALGDALPSHIEVYEDGVDVTSDFHQGADERTLRCAIGDYNGAAIYTVTYQRADYLMAWDDIGTYGILSRAWLDNTIGLAGTLLTRGRLELTKVKTPPITYFIEATDLSHFDGFDFDALELGSIVTVIDEDLGIDITVRITKIITHPDLYSLHRMQLELSNKSRNITDAISEMYRNLGVA